MEKGTSKFAALKNAQAFSEVLEFLAQENIAAIIEALRSEKWCEQLFPLYIGHPNHIIRYEVACSAQVDENGLKALAEDPEMIVRQAASQNLLARYKQEQLLSQAKESVAIKQDEVKVTQEESPSLNDTAVKSKKFKKENKKIKKVKNNLQNKGK